MGTERAARNHAQAIARVCVREAKAMLGAGWHHVRRLDDDRHSA